MKYAKWMWAAAIVLLPNVLPTLASAQLGDGRIVAKVPFEFRVVNKLVPAGEYTVQRGPGYSGALMIQNVRAGVGVVSNTSPGEIKKAADSCVLVFHRQGDQYFLRGIKLKDSRMTYKLPESKAEAELRAQNAPAREEIVLAALQ